jgi:hypothetical protein
LWKGGNIFSSKEYLLTPFSLQSPNLELIYLSNIKAQRLSYFHTGDHLNCVYFLLLPMLWLFSEDLKQNPQYTQFQNYMMDMLNNLVQYRTIPSYSVIIKELLCTYFSLLSSPDDYYTINSSKHSVIKDFFDSFCLPHLFVEKKNLADTELLDCFEEKHTFFFPHSKTVSLVFLKNYLDSECFTCAPLFLIKQTLLRIVYNEI